MKRFWDKVTIKDNQSCWEWTAGKRNGYGRFLALDGRRYRLMSAHRYVWFLVYGYHLNKKENVCHKCDNPGCVNPNHLFVGSQTQNMIDMVNKKRHHKQRNTHCPHGHEYSGENLCMRKGYRICKTCRRRKDKERQRRLRKAKKSHYQ